MSARRVESEDVAALALIALRMFEIKRADIRHLVIDEAQDFSPMEFYMLRTLTGNDSFTIVGDLMQGVHAYRGIGDWDEVAQGVFSGDVTRHNLITSYRSTVEIMNAANRAARAQPVPGQIEAQPVLRHGNAPVFMRFWSAREQAQRLEELIRTYLGCGYATIAIIGRTVRELKRIIAALPADLSVHLLDTDAEKYSGGVVAAPATGVKGLEFDCVIIADASDKAYPNAPLDARLLYVSMTRPLHELAVLAQGEFSALLGDIEAAEEG